MPRIPVLGPDEVTPEVRELFERFRQKRGNIPNMFRTLAYRPEIALTAEAHMRAVLETGTLSQALKELAVVRTSTRNRCAY